jgi:hypothetical protein
VKAESPYEFRNFCNSPLLMEADPCEKSGLNRASTADW